MSTVFEHTDELVSPAPLRAMLKGFWVFKVLAVAHELDVFGQLSGTAGVTIDEFARQWAIERRPADMLLTACASLGLLDKDGERYRNSAMAEEYLVPGRRYYLGGTVAFADQKEYGDWARLSEAIRTNRPVGWDPDSHGSLFDNVEPVFWESMHALSMSNARVLAGVVDFRRYRRLLDVGGGSGANDIELCSRYPHLRATVYDLPAAVAIAARKVGDAGLSDRIGTTAGDFFAGAELPGGHDAVLLSMVLHDWDEAQVQHILQLCFRAVVPGGDILITEQLVNDEKTGPEAAALNSLNMLVETVGRNYTGAEYRHWLAEVGCTDIRTMEFEAPGTNGVVIGTKPR